jgi:hypothetical protein
MIGMVVGVLSLGIAIYAILAPKQDRRRRAARAIAMDLETLCGVLRRIHYELTELRPQIFGVDALKADLEAALARYPGIVEKRVDLGDASLRQRIDAYYAEFIRYSRLLLERLEPYLTRTKPWPPKLGPGDVQLWCAGLARSIENQLYPDAKGLIDQLGYSKKK